MGRRKKFLGGFSILAVLASVIVIGASSSVTPAGAWVGPSSPNNAAVPMDCVATAPVVGEVPASQDITLVTSAPNKAEAGEQYDIFSQAIASTAPTNVSGFNINSIRAFEVRIPLPPNATRVNEQIVPATGSGFGSAGITWDGANSRWIFTVSGPIAGGASFQFPQIRIRVAASGAPGSFIEPRLGGNSKTNYGFSLIVNADLPSPIGTSDIPTACWPKQPNPAFVSTQIIPIDNSGPTIAVTTPANAGTYALNSTINSNYSCTEPTNGSGLASCVGTVANGTPINTASVGPKSFTVNASDNKGNTSTQTVNYNVVDQPAISVQPSWSFEGSPAQYQIVLSKPWPIPISVQYFTSNGSAIAGTDFTNATGTANFPANTLSVPINVNTTNDLVYQGELNYQFNLQNPVNALLATTSVTGRILDNETPAPYATGQTVTEGVDSAVLFDVSIPFDPGVPVNVAYQTVDGVYGIAGNDYGFTSGTLTFNPGGPLTQQVSVPVLDDGQDDGYSVDFSLSVTNVATTEVGEPGLASIIDNDGPPPVVNNVGINIGDTTIVEGDDTTRNAFLAVRLDRPVLVPTTFTIQTSDGSATVAGKDYKAETSTLTFQPGQTTRMVNIGMLPDTTAEPTEQMYVDVLAVGGGNPIGDGQGVVTILDDDSPTASDYVVSVGDAEMWEGNADLGQVEIPVHINSKRPKDTPDTDVEIQLDVMYGTAGAADVFVKKMTSVINFPGGVNKSLEIKIKGDTAVEDDEQLTVVASTTINTPPSVSIGRPVGTLTIRDDDGVPGQPISPAANTSTTKLGYVDFTWGAPVTGQPASEYEWRVATDGTLDTEPWTSTGIGLNRRIEHDCGEGNTCEYQVRAKTLVGPGPASWIVSATGLEDFVAPDLLVFSPRAGANFESYNALTLNGLVGTAFGDAKSATVDIYACANCTNIAPTQTLAATVLGAGWSATTSGALAEGVYTVAVTQTDWAGNTSTVIRGIETRNGIFVSATGNDANPGTAASPKLTILNGLNTAVSASRSHVVVGQGTYGALSLTTSQSNKAVRGGFDQYAGWVRPGTAGVAGVASQELTNIEAGPTAVLTNATTGLTIDSVRIKGSRTGQPAGSSIYGLRAISGSNVTLQNVQIIADAGVDGTGGAAGGSGASGNGGTEGVIGGETCSGTNTGPAGGTGANNGGKGGNAPCNNNGAAGNQGAGPGGAGGAGGNRANPLVGCSNGSPGGGGTGGNGGAVSGTTGAAGTGGTAGATWAGNNGTAGGAGSAGLGGGGGGAGGGTNNPLSLCGGNDWGGTGGSGGAGAAGGTGGALGTAGGGSFGVYAQNSTVVVDALSVITSGAGGAGGAGGAAGAGGNGGGGGRGGSVTNSGNGGAPVGNASPFPCGLFFPACYADGGPGGGGGGGGAGAGGNGGGGGAGGPTAAVMHSGTGSVTVAATMTAGAGGTGGAGGTAGANGLRGELGSGAAGAWSSGPNAGTQGGLATGTPAAGGTGSTGFTCKVHSGGSCIVP